MNDKKEPPQFNFNTVVGLICCGVITWTGATLVKLNEKVSKIETYNEVKIEQLNRIETKQIRMETQINELQIDLARIKPNKP